MQHHHQGFTQYRGYDQGHYDTYHGAPGTECRGKPINYETLWRWFKKATRRLGIFPSGNVREPTLHCLRHYFAVERLTEWCKQSMPVQDLLPNLSVYLGHVRPEDSYWYLTATPALLLTASNCFESKSTAGILS